MEAPLGQSRAQVPQEDAGLLLGERQDQIRMGLDPVRALIPTQRLGVDSFANQPLSPDAVSDRSDAALSRRAQAGQRMRAVIPSFDLR